MEVKSFSSIGVLPGSGMGESVTVANVYLPFFLIQGKGAFVCPLQFFKVK